MLGEDGNDKMGGSTGDDNMTGGDGTDRLYGQEDDDTMDGTGGPDDYCSGSSGNDLAFTGCEIISGVP